MGIEVLVQEGPKTGFRVNVAQEVGGIYDKMIARIEDVARYVHKNFPSADIYLNTGFEEFNRFWEAYDGCDEDN